ncbi:MAG TPA: hypothetical protein K8V05_17070 [Butyricimonas virosa]|uniref:Uncharacterized protein n=1 Tax=Butyricimonas virosa TaxID=544645 RepID=A0A921H811_9BACT|nr:hypothetical protein [Butyricimonas virosa]
MKIWTINSKKIDEIVDTYIDYMSNSKNYYRQTNDWKNEELDCLLRDKPLPQPESRALQYQEESVVVENLPRPHFDTIRPHFVSLLHVLFLRYISTGDSNADFTLNTSILQNMYRNYNYMLHVLKFHLVVQSNSESIGDFAITKYTITTPDMFRMTECKHRLVLKDLDKLSKIFKERHQQNIRVAKEKTSGKYIDNYNKMIKSFKLVDEEGVKRFMDEHKFDSIRSELYYRYTLNRLEQREVKEIEKVDDNGRCYHVGTQLPKNLKKFTNISYSIDCKNSHPLLFSYMIFDYYYDMENISINKQYKLDNENNRIYRIILQHIHDNYNNIHNKRERTYHYFMQELHNTLKNNNIDEWYFERVRQIPCDVLAYLYNVSRGMLWDGIHHKNSTVSRDEIKRIMFQEVFYSYGARFSESKRFATMFKKEFPGVAKILRYYKRIYHKQCMQEGKQTKQGLKNKDSVLLPLKLMQLESTIFREILTRLWKLKGARCFAIHDAIAVLNSTISSEKVSKMMKNVYWEIGLIPTLSIDFYN